MFHRRLLLLTAVMLLVLLVLSSKMTMLATGTTHEAARKESEAKLSDQHEIQTKRGAILDRNGLVLAEDEPGWELAVHFDLLTNKWGYKNAYTDASRDKLAWSEMSQPQREAKVARLQKEYDQQARAMFITLGELSGLGYPELDARRKRTVERIHRLQNHLWHAWQKKESEDRGEPVPLEQVAKPIEEETKHHVLITDMGDDLRLLVENFIEEGNRALLTGDDETRSALPWTMVELRRTTIRRYTLDRMTVELDRSTRPGPLADDEPMEMEVAGVGMHLIGLMRDAWEEDVEKDPLIDYRHRYRLSGYKSGDRLGRSGVEETMEKVLRGSRGLRTFNVDSGETTHLIEPRAGKDVVLSLDVRLQAHIQAIMSPEFELMTVLPWHLKTDEPQELLGMPLNGAAVVIDIASGDVLAAVSSPTGSRDLLDEDPDLLWNDMVNMPMVNRAVAVPYQPGSTLKPLVAIAALSDGVLGVNEKVDTPGHLWEDATVYRDWIFKLTGWQSFNDANGGPIDVIYATARSSNVFFGKMAERLIKRFGMQRLPWWYEQFGLANKPGTGLPEEISGKIGATGEQLQHNQVCFMAIGQGPVTCTPLQVATAYMRLASGDLNKQPRIVVSPERNEPRAGGGPRIDASYRNPVLEGMRQSANEHIGTTHHINHPASGLQDELIFNVEGVKIMAKSGTADPGKYRWIDYNRDGEQQADEIERSLRDHAWVVALVQPEGASQPTHAIACVVEYAGSGGRVAGPVVNQIIHALKRHQYLDWPPTR